MEAVDGVAAAEENLPIEAGAAVSEDVREAAVCAVNEGAVAAVAVGGASLSGQLAEDLVPTL